jgi:hypothetical protein
MTPSENRIAGQQLARSSRRRQGLPRRVSDRDVVRRLVALLFALPNGRRLP